MWQIWQVQKQHQWNDMPALRGLGSALLQAPWDWCDLDSMRATGYFDVQVIGSVTENFRLIRSFFFCHGQETLPTFH